MDDCMTYDLVFLSSGVISVQRYIGQLRTGGIFIKI